MQLSGIWLGQALPGVRAKCLYVHATIFAWSGLILDHSRKHIGLQSLAVCATHSGGDSGTSTNFENYDLFHAHSWRANHRDVDVRFSQEKFEGPIAGSATAVRWPLRGTKNARWPAIVGTRTSPSASSLFYSDIG